MIHSRIRMQARAAEFVRLERDRSRTSGLSGDPLEATCIHGMIVPSPLIRSVTIGRTYVFTGPFGPVPVSSALLDYERRKPGIDTVRVSRRWQLVWSTVEKERPEHDRQSRSIHHLSRS